MLNHSTFNDDSHSSTLQQLSLHENGCWLSEFAISLSLSVSFSYWFGRKTCGVSNVSASFVHSVGRSFVWCQKNSFAAIIMPNTWIQNAQHGRWQMHFQICAYERENYIYIWTLVEMRPILMHRTLFHCSSVNSFRQIFFSRSLASLFSIRLSLIVGASIHENVWNHFNLSCNYHLSSPWQVQFLFVQIKHSGANKRYCDIFEWITARDIIQKLNYVPYLKDGVHILNGVNFESNLLDTFCPATTSLFICSDFRPILNPFGPLH